MNRVLEEYAARGVFRGFSAGPERGGKATFRMVWHHDRPFELIFDPDAKTLVFPALLPAIPRDSAMYRELKLFLKARHSEKLPPHRRINPARARLRCTNQRGAVSVGITVLDQDFDHATRKLIHIVHEIFLVFLAEGPYYEYMVEHLGLDPDRY